MCKGSEKSKGEKPIHHQNAMYEGGTIGVEIKRVGEKENEISCLPDYLKQFELSETIVTMDAMGCNQTVIKAIHNGEGNYVLPVKENQQTARRNDAVTNGAILRRFCMMLKSRMKNYPPSP